MGTGGLATIIGFFFTTTGGFGCTDSSFGVVAAISVLSNFIFVVTELTEEVAVGRGGDKLTVVTEAFERGSPRRLSKTDFSAYSLIYIKLFCIKIYFDFFITLFNFNSSRSVKFGRTCFSPRHFHNIPRLSNALSRTVGSASPEFYNWDIISFSN